MRMAPYLLAALAFGGCGDGPPDPEDTDEAQEPQVRIVAVGWECEDTGWVYTLGTDGWTQAVDLEVFAVSEWAGGPNEHVYVENHELVEIAFGEDHAWTRWEVVLAPATRQTQQNSVSTALVCEEEGPEQYAFLARLFVDAALSDCGIWGQRSADYYETALRLDCYCFDTDRGCGAW